MVKLQDSTKPEVSGVVEGLERVREVLQGPPSCRLHLNNGRIERFFLRESCGRLGSSSTDDLKINLCKLLTSLFNLNIVVLKSPGPVVVFPPS